MELGNVPQLVAESYGYAVLPTIGKPATFPWHRSPLDGNLAGSPIAS